MTPIIHSGERGSLIEHVIVRLADEGVPIKALVRVFRKPFEQVEELLGEALSDGLLLALPAADWPIGTSRGDRMPTNAPERGDVPMWLVLGARFELGLTMSEAQIVAALVWKGKCSKAWLHERIAPEAEPKIVDVFICKVRKKLAPFQYSVITEWGWGYRMSEDDRAAIRGRSGRYEAAEVAA